jgi:peptidoglycan-associated lipoprotein
MRRLLFSASVVALAVGSTACASKKFVNNRVSEVNDKITTMSSSLEETQERTRRNEQRITEVSDRTDAASARATAADRAAADARGAADAAAGKADDLDRSLRRLVYEVVLSEDKTRFRLGQAMLSSEAKTELDRLVETLQQDPKNVFLEIEGHTDSLGAPALNEQLGRRRAEAVRLYLYEQHSIPLHKMNIVTYGETKPIAPNDTRAGRAQNRRVVIKVLS